MYFGNVVLAKELTDSGNIVPITASTALSSASYGKVFVIGAPGNFTITLMPLQVIAKANQFTLINDSTGTTTVNAGGTDVIRLLGTNVGSFSLAPGDTVTLENNGSTWVVAANSIKKANLDSPVFTGDPKAPTPSTTDNDTSIATTAFTNALLNFYGIGVTAPTASTNDLDTFLTTGLYSVASGAPNNPASTNSTLLVMTSNIGVAQILMRASVTTENHMWFRSKGSSNGWQPWVEVAGINSPAFTGSPVSTTPPIGNNGTRIATTEFVIAEIANQFSKSGQQSLVANGYQKLPGDLILQWGSVSYGAGSNTGTVTATFPISFPSACLKAVATDNGTSGVVVSVTSTTTTQVNMSLFQRASSGYSASSATFFAIGK